MSTPIKPPVATPGDVTYAPKPEDVKPAQEIAGSDARPVYTKLLSAKEILANYERMTPREILDHIEARKAIQAELQAIEAAEQEAKAAEARLRVVEEIIIEKEREQLGCTHRKQNGEPRIGAQRVHSGNVNYVCQWCGKIWRNNELPPNLAIDSARVGGP